MNINRLERSPDFIITYSKSFRQIFFDGFVTLYDHIYLQGHEANADVSLYALASEVEHRPHLQLVLHLQELAVAAPVDVLFALPSVPVCLLKSSSPFLPIVCFLSCPVVRIDKGVSLR